MLITVNWEKGLRDFPGGPVGKAPLSQHRRPGSTPGQGTKSHMLQLRPGIAR